MIFNLLAFLGPFGATVFQVVSATLAHPLVLLEWGGVACSLTGAVFNVRRRRLGFLWWSAANLFFAVFALTHGYYGLLMLQCIYLPLNLTGFVKWKRVLPPETAPAAPEAV